MKQENRLDFMNIKQVSRHSRFAFPLLQLSGKANQNCEWLFAVLCFFSLSLSRSHSLSQCDFKHRDRLFFLSVIAANCSFLNNALSTIMATVIPSHRNIILCNFFSSFFNETASFFSPPHNLTDNALSLMSEADKNIDSRKITNATC